VTQRDFGDVQVPAPGELGTELPGGLEERAGRIDDAALLEPVEEGFADWRQVLAVLASRYSEPDRTSTLERAAEYLFAATALVLTFPIMLLVALAVRLGSPGPALFRQLRVGRGGRLFVFTKFRTHYADASERFPQLYAYRYTRAEIEHLRFKAPDDPRVTRVGEWLRRSTLDELPNFWHVLTGDMSLVGPRPEIPEMLPYYSDEHLIKFSVRPGITGLAQISGRGRLRFLETAELDAEYVRKRSAGLDLRILARTIYLILRRDGAF
jgi:lipopolysaccharide/colanic/teichoic acid biosynthesis glycosyltransferase